MNELAHEKTGLLDEDHFSESLAAIGPDDSSIAGSRGAVCEEDDGSEEVALEPATPSDVAQARTHAWEGKRLGHFRLLRLLGKGGMGMVVQAMDINLERIVALKILRKRIPGMDQKQGVKQFLREARAAAKIDHPNVAHIYEINEHDGWWYIASEMIEGGTLSQVVKAAGKLPPAAACPLIADAAEALRVAHQLGLVHRDVKPHNLMLTRDGRCKLVDFGLVRLEDPNDPFDFTTQAVGTPHYLPPEAASHQRPSPKFDIYSLGATLYYALAGQPPFHTPALDDLVKMHRTAPRPDVREHNTECSEHLAGLIQRAMAIDPSQRPDAAQFAAELRVENIGTQVDIMSLVADPSALLNTSPHDSSAGLPGFSGALSASRTMHDSGAHSDIPSAATPFWVWVGRISAVAVIACVLLVGGTWLVQRMVTALSSNQAADAEAFAERFPDAPESYGMMQPGQTPAPQPIEPPAFSWRSLSVDPGGAAYAAHKNGRHAYPIDSPNASLIAAAEVVFYDDVQAIRDAGKSLAD